MMGLRKQKYSTRGIPCYLDNLLHENRRVFSAKGNPLELRLEDRPYSADYNLYFENEKIGNIDELWDRYADLEEMANDLLRQLDAAIDARQAILQTKREKSARKQKQKDIGLIARAKQRWSPTGC